MTFPRNASNNCGVDVFELCFAMALFVCLVACLFVCLILSPFVSCLVSLLFGDRCSENLDEYFDKNRQRDKL